MNQQTLNDEFMLTTVDNPFNPFDDFEIWWKEDLRLGHDCCGILAQESNTSSIFGDDLNNQFILDAMDRIVESFPSIYRKVTREDYQTTLVSN